MAGIFSSTSAEEALANFGNEGLAAWQNGGAEAFWAQNPELNLRATARLAELRAAAQVWTGAEALRNA